MGALRQAPQVVLTASTHVRQLTSGTGSASTSQPFGVVDVMDAVEQAHAAA